MSLPCKSCLVFPMCRAKAHRIVNEMDIGIKAGLTAVQMIGNCPFLSKDNLDLASSKITGKDLSLLEQVIQVFDLSEKNG